MANVIADLIPAAFQNTGQIEINRCECDHRRFKARPRPMRRLMTVGTASVVIRGVRFPAKSRQGTMRSSFLALPTLSRS